MAVGHIMTVAVTVVVIDIPFVGIREGGAVLLLMSSLIELTMSIWLLLELIPCKEVHISTAPSRLSELGAMLHILVCGV